MTALRYPIGLALGLTLALGACTAEDAAEDGRDARTGNFSLVTERRAELGAIGGDTLSEAARFLSLLPEADGDAIVFTFGDSARGVTSGLGIIDRRTGKLAREANALLVASDERIRTAQQEVGYVEAAYGPDETAPLRAALVSRLIRHFAPLP